MPKKKHVNRYLRLRRVNSAEANHFPISGIQYDGPECFDDIMRLAQFSPGFSDDGRTLALTTNQIENVFADGAMIKVVAPGDYIIKENGKILVCKHEDFYDQYTEII